MLFLRNASRMVGSSGQQLTQHERQDAAMLVVVDFDRVSLFK